MARRRLPMAFTSLKSTTAKNLVCRIALACTRMATFKKAKERPAWDPSKGGKGVHMRALVWVQKKESRVQFL